MSRPTPLPTAVPESVGIPSDAIEAFLRKILDKRLCMHSVLLVRHGKLICECYWKPFNRDRKHRMYSTSKSFVSAAIGILIGEEKLSLDSTIAELFPEWVPENPSPWTLEATVRDLLRMSTHISRTSYCDTCPDWGKSFVQYPVSHKPGQVFRYDTSATTTLNILVHRLTGMEFTEFLREKLFIPAGMNDDIWCVETPCGHEWGGSGVQATPQDLAKFALVCMNGGRWNGQQLIPEDYIRAATSRLIDNSLLNTAHEEQQGYGYQFWRMTHNAFATLGMGSQCAICVPDRDLVLVFTGDTQGQPFALQNITDALWDTVYPALSDMPLKDNPAAYDSLTTYTSTRELLCVEGALSSPMSALVSGSTYRMTENDLGWTSLRFDFDGDRALLRYNNGTGAHEILFGIGRNIPQAFTETQYYDRRIGVPAGYGLECHASAAWVEDRSLLTRVWITDTCFGNLKMQFTFDGDTVTMLADKNAEWFLQGYHGFASGSRA